MVAVGWILTLSLGQFQSDPQLMSAVPSTCPLQLPPPPPHFPFPPLLILCLHHFIITDPRVLWVWVAVSVPQKMQFYSGKLEVPDLTADLSIDTKVTFICFLIMLGSFMVNTIYPLNVHYDLQNCEVAKFNTFPMHSQHHSDFQSWVLNDGFPELFLKQLLPAF